MSHQANVFWIAILMACIIGLAVLAVGGCLILWLMVRQPAKWKMLDDRFESFLIAKRLLPASVIRALNRYNSPILEKTFVGFGLVVCVVGLFIFIRGVWPHL